MKKIILLILLIIGCQKNQESNINIDESEFWHIKFFVNQFNELTDVGYITNINPIFGTYKDLKRDDARKLKVKMMIKERAVGIKLYENESDQSVKGAKQNPIEYEMTMKHNDQIIDFIFKAINETDVVVIGNVISSTHQNKLINYLKLGGKFEFILKTISGINKKEYKFEINDNSKSGFIDNFENLK